MLKKAMEIIKDERGQGLAEYGLILALIAVVCIAVITTVGKGIESKMEEVGDALQ